VNENLAKIRQGLRPVAKPGSKDSGKFGREVTPFVEEDNVLKVSCTAKIIARTKIGF
jgi:hypothetical protein